MFLYFQADGSLVSISGTELDLPHDHIDIDDATGHGFLHGGYNPDDWLVVQRKLTKRVRVIPDFRRYNQLVMFSRYRRGKGLIATVDRDALSLTLSLTGDGIASSRSSLSLYICRDQEPSLFTQRIVYKYDDVIQGQLTFALRPLSDNFGLCGPPICDSMMVRML